MTFIDPDDAPTRLELWQDIKQAAYNAKLVEMSARDYPLCPMTEEPCLDPHCAQTGCEAEREDELR